MAVDSVEEICNMALGYAGVNQFINDINASSASAQACAVYYEQTRDSTLAQYEWKFATRRALLTNYTGNNYDATHTYAKGDTVAYGAVIFRSLVDNNTGNTPTSSPAQWFQLTRDGWAYVAPMPGDVIRALEVYLKPTLSPTGTPLTWQVQAPPPLRAMRSDQRIPFDIEDANDGSGIQVILTDLQQPILRYTARIDNPGSYSDAYIDALAWSLAPQLCMALTADVKRAQALKMASASEIREAIALEMRSIRADPEPYSEFEAAREN